jgi:hypothetical protein
MSEASFTRAFRAAGIARWPYRRIQSLMSAIDRFNERIANELDADMRHDLCYERDLLLHEREFLCRNPETLGISSLSNQHCSSRKYIHLPMGFARLHAPASPAQIEQMQLANRSRKSLLRGTKRSAVPMPAKRARVVKRPPPLTTGSSPSAHPLNVANPSHSLAPIAATSNLSTSIHFKQPPPPPPQQHRALLLSDPSLSAASAPPPPPPPRSMPNLRCMTYHTHEPNCFVDLATVAPVGSTLPPLVAQARPTQCIPLHWNKP